METITIVNNLHFNRNGLYADTGNLCEISKVFVSKGGLDSNCTLQCLVMLLIIQQKLKLDDVICKHTNTENSEFVKSFKNVFLKNDGYFCRDNVNVNLYVVAKKLLKMNNGIKTTKSYTSTPSSYGNVISRAELTEKISRLLYGGSAIIIGYYNLDTQSSNTAVVVGYSEDLVDIRLFCLDPTMPLPCNAYWNHIIDLSLYEDPMMKMYVDWSQAENCRIIVENLLFI